MAGRGGISAVMCWRMTAASIGRKNGPAERSASTTFGADCIVAEVNQGGELVEAMIKAEARGRTIPFKAVHATRGKHVRAV